MGTSTGTVHVLELSGANAGGEARQRLQVSASGARLNDLCCEISVRRAAARAARRATLCAPLTQSRARPAPRLSRAQGDFIGAACEDGSVSIASLASDERAVHSHHRAVKALRLVRCGAALRARGRR